MIIDKNGIYNALFKNEFVGQGCYGYVTKYDKDTLIKIYYKDIIDTYMKKDIALLDEEIEWRLKAKKMFAKNDPTADDRQKKKFNVLSKIGLLKDELYYNGYLIGILMTYYNGYEDLNKIFPKLTSEQKITILEGIKNKLQFLKDNNIYATDVKEPNILVKLSDLDIAMIDLDDNRTRYEDKEYIMEFPYIIQNVDKEYKDLVKRLDMKYNNHKSKLLDLDFTSFMQS